MNSGLLLTDQDAPYITAVLLYVPNTLSSLLPSDSIKAPLTCPPPMAKQASEIWQDDWDLFLAFLALAGWGAAIRFVNMIYSGAFDSLGDCISRDASNGLTSSSFRWVETNTLEIAHVGIVDAEERVSATGWNIK